MKKTIDRNLLKYSAGNSIFCKYCGDVADYRRWVVATSPSGAKTICCCVNCWNETTKNAFKDQLAGWDIVSESNSVNRGS